MFFLLVCDPSEGVLPVLNDCVSQAGLEPASPVGQKTSVDQWIQVRPDALIELTSTMVATLTFDVLQ